MFKLIKIGFLLSFTGVVIYFVYDFSIEKGSFESYIYWLFLIDLLCLILFYKIDSRLSSYTAFVLFLTSSIILSLGYKSVAEFIMRLSFIMLLIGYIQSLIESRRSKLVNPDS